MPVAAIRHVPGARRRPPASSKLGAPINQSIVPRYDGMTNPRNRRPAAGVRPQGSMAGQCETPPPCRGESRLAAEKRKAFMWREPCLADHYKEKQSTPLFRSSPLSIAPLRTRPAQCTQLLLTAHPNHPSRLIPSTIVSQQHHVVSSLPRRARQLPAARKHSTLANGTPSGIFGYINYLVEKDRKYILNTLINGKSTHPLRLPPSSSTSSSSSSPQHPANPHHRPPASRVPWLRLGRSRHRR